MRLAEARDVLGITSDSTSEDARRAYRRLALTAHPDKNSSPDATEHFQRIQDAFTRIQASEESARGGGSDEDDEDDEDYDDEYYDEYEAFEEAAFMFMFAFGGGPPPGFGGQFGSTPPRGFEGFSHPGSEQCDCRDCRAERNAFERQEEARQAALRESARREAARKRAWAEERQKAEAELHSARQRAREARKETEGGDGMASATPRPTVRKAEQLRQRGNKAFAEGKYARAVSQYSAALKEMAPARDGKVLSNRSAAYVKLERYDMAMKDADECAALCPEWDKPLARRAIALSGLGKHLEAADAFEAAAAKCTDGAEPSRSTQSAQGIVPGGAKAKAEYMRLAAAQREAHADIIAKAEEARRLEAEKAERRRQEALQREAEAERVRNEVAFELHEATARDDEKTLERCLSAAQRHGVAKPDLAAARTKLKKLVAAREAAQQAARELEAAEAVAADLCALLDDSSATRSGLKSALRRAEAVGVERVETGSTLLARARERLGALAQGAKEAKEARERKDAEERAAAEAEARANEVRLSQQRAEAHHNLRGGARAETESSCVATTAVRAAASSASDHSSAHSGRPHRLFESGGNSGPPCTPEDDEARERAELEMALALSLQQQQLEAQAILNPVSCVGHEATIIGETEVQRQQQMVWQGWQHLGIGATGVLGTAAAVAAMPESVVDQQLHLQHRAMQSSRPPMPVQAPHRLPPQHPTPSVLPPHGNPEQSHRRHRTRPPYEQQPPQALPQAQYFPPTGRGEEHGGIPAGHHRRDALHERLTNLHRLAGQPGPNNQSVGQSPPPPHPANLPTLRQPSIPPAPGVLPADLVSLVNPSTPCLSHDPWATKPDDHTPSAGTWHPLGVGAAPPPLGGVDPWGGAGVFAAPAPCRPVQPNAQRQHHASSQPLPSRFGTSAAPFDFSQLHQTSTSFDTTHRNRR
mmetsp:Transcript_12316/g.37743  ORF Transcript_12316/g.37743 Transcript_12316/m.37743 type:complete len:934 (+) Transcript_12316:2-2803(+)